MDLLVQHDPVISFRKRMMTLHDSHHTSHVRAHRELESLPASQSSLIEACTLQALSCNVFADDSDWDHAVLGVVQHDDRVHTPADSPCPCGQPTISVDSFLSGPGAEQPEMEPLLREYRDVLVSDLPDGLPPERFARDGTRIEHTIQTASDTKPYARPPPVFTGPESKEIRKYLDDFLGKGWITPLVSPWAAPVLFVPKKRDPTTGERTWRMCISYVKLNSKTLNRIAYRLPGVADLLARVSGSKFPS